MKSISSISLYDLMAEDLDVWLSPSSQQGFKIEIDCLEGEGWACTETIHPFAADSFADFCRRYLASYDRLTLQDNKTGARNA